MVLHPDFDSFDNIWSKLISEEIKKYEDAFSPFIYSINSAKDEVWKVYSSLNEECKRLYMADGSKKLDRHKVAACYMIAICTVKPVKLCQNNKYEESIFVVNELIAINIGMSIVAAYAISAAEEDKSLDSNEKKRIINSFKDGLKYPEKTLTHHGEYISNYATELYFGGEEGKLNTLSIAHELYLLEVLTTQNNI